MTSLSEQTNDDLADIVVKAICDPKLRRLQTYNAAKIVGYVNAEDIVQAAYLKAFAARGTFDGRPINKWLERIVKNEAIQYTRKHKPIYVDPNKLLCKTTIASPERDFQGREFWQYMHRLIDELIPSQKRQARMVILRKCIGSSEKELSEKFDGVPKYIVKNSIHRGTALLRRKLADYSDSCTF